MKIKLTKDEKKSNEYHYTYDGTHASVDEVWWNFSARWDGCVDITRYFNYPRRENENDFDTLHICDLGEFIEMLQDLHARLKQELDYEG